MSIPKSGKGKCKTPYCRNKPRPSGTCSSCYKRLWREQNPLKATFEALRNNAKRRGHEFDLSLEEFSQFCIETNYLMGKGRTKTSYTIDRIDETKGYTAGNLQVLTNTENVKKRYKVLTYNVEEKRGYFIDLTKNDKQDDCPF